MGESCNRPLKMGCVDDCILGQVFSRGPRRFFGLVRVDDGHYCGWGRGLGYFRTLGVTPPPFVFSSDAAAPFWKAEIAKRLT